MLDTIIEYCKNNLVLTAILAACVFLVVLSMFALCVKKSIAKKRAKKVARTTPVAVETPTPTLQQEAAPAVVEEEPKAEEPALETPVEEPIEESALETPAEEPIEESVAEEPAEEEPVTKTIEEPVTETVEEPVQEPIVVKTPTMRKKPATQSPRTTRVKPSRYTGKWVICRVLTAAHAEGNLGDDAAEEMFFFELHASNGEKLLTSEEYTSLSGAVAGIATHKANIEKNRFRITLSKKGDYIFKLLNGKNMLLCMGEHYATKTRCESAIESTKRFAATAIVDDNVQDIVIPNPTEDEPEVEIPDNGYTGKWIIRAHTAEDFEQVFYFELYASNGEKLLSSEEYTTYTGAVNGIETHKTNIEKDRFRISFTKRGDYIYKLLNGNGQLLCLGEHYKTRRRCESAIESVKRFAKNAPVLADPETVSKHS